MSHPSESQMQPQICFAAQSAAGFDAIGIAVTRFVDLGKVLFFRDIDEGATDLVSLRFKSTTRESPLPTGRST